MLIGMLFTDALDRLWTSTNFNKVCTGYVFSHSNFVSVQHVSLPLH